MELAKITTKGQITLPIAVRRKLNLFDGGKVAFIENGGQYIVVKPTMLAFENAQRALAGEAERLGLKDVEDVVKIIKEVRAKETKET
jgi:AbrB family looped-hinge helix DNA binding protein